MGLMGVAGCLVSFAVVVASVAPPGPPAAPLIPDPTTVGGDAPPSASAPREAAPPTRAQPPATGEATGDSPPASEAPPATTEPPPESATAPAAEPTALATPPAPATSATDDTASEEPLVVAPVEPGELTAADLEGFAPSDAERNEQKVRRTRGALAAGAVAAVAGGILLIAAHAERKKPECDFGLDDCADPPRRGVTRGLGISGAVLLFGGGALAGWSAIRLTRLRTEIWTRDRTAGVTLSGRF